MTARRLHLAVFALGLLGGTGCSGGVDFSEETVLGSTSDGTAVFAAVADSATSARVLKVDADGEPSWELTIGRSYGDMTVHDGYLWIVEDEPEGSTTTDYDSPDVLLKIDAQSGEIVASAKAGAEVIDAPIVIGDQVWLLDLIGKGLLVIDADQLTVLDRLNLNIGRYATEPVPPGEVRGLVSGPIESNGWIYAIGYDPASIVRISVDRREIDAVLTVDLRIRTNPEEHDGTIWVPESVSTAADATGWLAHPLDPDGFELGEPVPYFESPMRSLVTDDFVFDQTGLDEITQIDRATGEVVRIIEGWDPRFVLEDHLWLRDLRRIDLR